MAAIVTNRAKVVISTETNGVPFRILTAIDRGDRGALFSPYKFSNFEAESDLPIKEEHLSVWCNDGAKNVYIHHTYILDGKHTRKIDYSTLIDIDDAGFAFPVLTSSISDRQDRPLTNVSSSKYEIVKIPSYDVIFNTLILCYAVSSFDAVFPNLEQFGIALVEVPFSRVKIGLYYTYFTLPTGEFGWNKKLTTSARRVNDGEVLQCGGPFFRKATEFQSYVLGEISDVYAGHIDMMKNKFLELGKSPEEVSEVFEALPCINTIAPISTLLSRGQIRSGTLWGEQQIG
jgi:hypothetical protein